MYVCLAVSYANETPEIWDLRHNVAPKFRLQGGHSSAVFGVDYNPHDHDILVSAGHDKCVLPTTRVAARPPHAVQNSHIVAWNPNSGELLENYNTDASHLSVNWSPHLVSLAATTTLDGRVRQWRWRGQPHGMRLVQVEVRSINHSGNHVPSWLKRPAGATFGFGGRVAKFAAGAERPAVTIERLVTEPSVVEHAEVLQQALAQGDLRSFCQHRISSE
jgi:protein transport protein SEC31